MKAVLKKVSENNKHQMDINSRHSAEKSPASSLFSSNNNISIKRSPYCPCGGGCPRCRGVIQPKTHNQPARGYIRAGSRPDRRSGDGNIEHPATSSEPPRIQRFSGRSNGLDSAPASVGGIGWSVRKER
jgi:hypothetical protein